MNRYLNEALESFEIRLGLELPWYKRLWNWLRGKKEEEWIEITPDIEDNVQEIDIRVLVSECVETALSATVWANRETEDVAPGNNRYTVSNVLVRDLGDSFWLYVVLEHNDDAPTMIVPLHEFLEQCYPLENLTFTDYHS